MRAYNSGFRLNNAADLAICQATKVSRLHQLILIVTRLAQNRLFINEISSNPDNAMILSAPINIGNSLKHRVVAEGVETEEQLHFLQHEGCSEGQSSFSDAP